MQGDAGAVGLQANFPSQLEQQPMNAPYKRTLCKFWLEGHCGKGDACTWSHGEDSAAVSPAMNLPGQAFLSTASLPQPLPLVKRTLCKFFEAGSCDKGEYCTWAHGPEEVGQAVLVEVMPSQDAEEAYMMPEVPVPNAMPVGDGSKRTLCKFWLEGKCRNGDLCTWAHGEHELSNVPLQDEGVLMSAPPTQTKRTLCKFWQEGKCDKGELCTWAHGEEDMGTPFIDELALQMLQEQALQEQFVAEAAQSAPVKKTLCKFWQQGVCDKGELCTWAHGVEDMGSPSANNDVLTKQNSTILPIISQSAVLDTQSRLAGPACAPWRLSAAAGTQSLLAGAAAALNRSVGVGMSGGIQPLGEQVNMGKGGSLTAPRLALAAFAPNPQVPAWRAEAALGAVSSSKRMRDDYQQGLGLEGTGENIIRRTICKFWQAGTCTASPCTWAHGEHELGTAAPAAPPAGARIEAPCRFYATTGCAKGASCPFLHLDETPWLNTSSSVPQVKRARLA